MRMINIVLTELAADKLKAEENLQRLINGTDEVNEQVLSIKTALREITMIDQMINKWKSYTAPQDGDNNNNNNN
jgi:hypothetical protein